MRSMALKEIHEELDSRNIHLHSRGSKQNMDDQATGLVKRYVDTALQENDFFNAAIGLQALGDETELKRIAKVALETNPFESYSIFRKMTSSAP